MLSWVLHIWVRVLVGAHAMLCLCLQSRPHQCLQVQWNQEGPPEIRIPSLITHVSTRCSLHLISIHCTMVIARIQHHSTPCDLTSFSQNDDSCSFYSTHFKFTFMFMLNRSGLTDALFKIFIPQCLDHLLPIQILLQS